MSVTPTPTPAYFLDLFDEFQTVKAPKIQMYLNVAATRVSQPVWGPNWTFAVCLLTAHMISCTGRASEGGSGGADGGPVTQESVGDLSRSYGTVGQPGTGDQELLTTRYGQEFVSLRRETVVAGSVTGSAIPSNGGWP